MTSSFEKADCNKKNCFKKRPVDEACDRDYLDIAQEIATRTKDDL